MNDPSSSNVLFVIEHEYEPNSSERLLNMNLPHDNYDVIVISVINAKQSDGPTPLYDYLCRVTTNFEINKNRAAGIGHQHLEYFRDKGWEPEGNNPTEFCFVFEKPSSENRGQLRRISNWLTFPESKKIPRNKAELEEIVRSEDFKIYQAAIEVSAFGWPHVS